MTPTPDPSQPEEPGIAPEVGAAEEIRATRSQRTFWQRLGGEGLTISLIIHLVLILIAAIWVISTVTDSVKKDPDSFSTGSGGGAAGDKAKAFKLYSQHYLGTHGQCYWADTMQLSTYIPSYADYLERASPADQPAGPKQTLVIGELYVPRDQIAAFMTQAARVLKTHGVEVIYGTIRAILKDDTSFLPWAKDDFACVIFNLRTVHTDEGKARTAEAFRGLIDAALVLGGSYFLTYHRYATETGLLEGQLAAAYAPFPAFSVRPAFGYRYPFPDPEGATYALGLYATLFPTELLGLGGGASYTFQPATGASDLSFSVEGTLRLSPLWLSLGYQFGPSLFAPEGVYLRLDVFGGSR